MRGALGLACLLAAAGCSKPPRRVVLITIDTLRADHVGPRAGAESLTPALDALARDGVAYDDAITNCVVTRCAHVSLFTGRYPWGHGVLDNSTPYTGDSLPQRLRSLGVATGAVVSSLPAKGLLPGFDWSHEGFDAAEAGRTTYPVKRPEQTTRAAARFLETRSTGPFLLWVHYFPPHGPYTPPEPLLRGLEAPAGARLQVSKRNYEKGRIPAYQALPEVFDSGEYRRRYAAHVRYVDSFVGRLLDRLREEQLYDDTLIIATSDHGESLGEHGFYFQHGNLAYEEQARIPLIVKWPGRRHAGARIPAPVELVDVAPTVAAFLGLQDFAADGVILPDPGATRARRRFSQSNDAELVAVYDGPLKLIWKRGPTAYTDPDYPALELFRLRQDAGETRNLAAAEPEAAGRLLAELRRRYASVTTPPRPDVSELEEPLRALGYVN